MKVCLINLPDLHSLDPMLDPPLGLMYISSYLKSRNVSTHIIDLSMYGRKDWEYILACNADNIFGITVNSPALPLVIEIAGYIRKLHSDAKIVAGGPHPTAKPNETKSFGLFDYIVRGEGEHKMLQITKGYEPSYSHSTLPINMYPFPDRESIDIHAYTRTVNGIHSCSMITSRGCPYRCAFCSSRLMWNKVRFRDPWNVAQELRVIWNLGFKAVHFWDDTFTLRPKRLKKILSYIKDFDFIFRCNGNLRNDTKEIHQLLYDSGCREYCIGVESGSQKILNILNKNTTVERNKEVIQSAKDVGLTVKAYLMVGSPGETWETIEETRRFIEEIQPDQWTLFNFVPMPGCDVYENPDKYKIKLDNVAWENYFCIGGNNVGGLTHSTERMTKEDIAEARKYLLKFLPKQKGKLQNYYRKIKSVT